MHFWDAARFSSSYDFSDALHITCMRSIITFLGVSDRYPVVHVLGGVAGNGLVTVASINPRNGTKQLIANQWKLLFQLLKFLIEA